VTLETLAPFRAFTRADGDQRRWTTCSHPPTCQGGLDIALEVWLQTAAMQAAGHPVTVSTSITRDAWSVASLVAHHTVNAVQPAPWRLAGQPARCRRQRQAGLDDGAERRGKQPLVLSNGETAPGCRQRHRDAAATAEPGSRRIGLGVCSGTVLE
jgi:fumarylacetoacetase